jgi:hypothetical protein
MNTNEHQNVVVFGRYVGSFLIDVSLLNTYLHQNYHQVIHEKENKIEFGNVVIKDESLERFDLFVFTYVETLNSELLRVYDSIEPRPDLFDHKMIEIIGRIHSNMVALEAYIKRDDPAYYNRLLDNAYYFRLIRVIAQLRNNDADRKASV